jgi:hypothetical protein
MDAQDAYGIGFRCSTYEQKEDKIKFLMALVPGPTRIGFKQKCRNNFNIQSPTCPGAVHIKTNVQAAYNTQLGSSWTPWKGKEIAFLMELVPYPNSTVIHGNHQNNWAFRICLGVVPSFLAFGPCIVSSPLGLQPRGTCTSLDPL